MPVPRPCSCDKCGHHFDYVHHLHRHGVLQHGLGFRVDPDTDCVQAYRPPDLTELQRKFRGWQQRQHNGDATSPYPRQSRPLIRESAGRGGWASSMGRAGRGSRSRRQSRSRSPLASVSRRDVITPSDVSHRSRAGSSRVVLPPVTDVAKCHTTNGIAPSPAAEPMPVCLAPDFNPPPGVRESLSTSKAALCVSTSLEERIDELLRTPEDPGSPSQLADISFGMDPFGDLLTSTLPARSSAVVRTVPVATPANPSTSRSQPTLDRPVNNFFVMNPFGDQLTSTPPARNSSVIRSVPVATASFNPSTSRLQPSLVGVGDVSMVIGRWPQGEDEAWALLRPGLPMPVDNHGFVQDFRTIRSTARLMAGLILSLPGFDDSAERLPACVVDWLCRFFS